MHMINKLRSIPFDFSYIVPVALGMFLLFSLISISISQIFLATALLVWAWMLFSSKQKIEIPGFFWPLLAYVAISLLASIRSVNPGISFIDLRDMLLFVIVPLVYTGFNRIKSVEMANRMLLLSFFLMAFFYFFYFFFRAEPGERITGFMGHWMTQAGLLLLFSALALCQFFFRRDKYRIPWGVGFVLSLPLIVLTLTRNSWVGLLFAVFVVILLYRPKLLVVLPLLAVAFFVVSPRHIRDRALSTFDLKNPTNRQRFEYWDAGIKIIKEFPLHGTGPNTVELEFQKPKYGLSAEAKSNVHLHNNFLQIAAERGVFALAVWIGFLVMLLVSLIRMVKARDPVVFPYAAGALAVWVGLITAGFFEYNFGDSEVVTLFLYIITLPFALERIQRKES